MQVVDATDETDQRAEGQEWLTRLVDSGIVSVTASASRYAIEGKARRGPETITEIWGSESEHLEVHEIGKDGWC